MSLHLNKKGPQGRAASLLDYVVIGEVANVEDPAMMHLGDDGCAVSDTGDLGQDFK